MHFALPTRNRRSSPFLASTVPRAQFSGKRPVYAALCLVLLLSLALLRATSTSRPASSPKTVLVLLIDESSGTYSQSYINRVIENRKSYAEAHGYGLFVRNLADYPIGSVPTGWARIPALRHAMREYRHSTYFWALDQDAVIVNMGLSLEAHVLAPARLDDIMRRDVPVVPPNSVIRTYRHVPAERVQMIITQDEDGLQAGSMIVRAGSWANYLLDAWFDPIFRYYGFQKEEQHALEHIVQWHPTILTKIALVPQKIMNSYPEVPGLDGAYEDGDLVVRLKGCAEEGRSCEEEFQKYWKTRTPLK